MLPYHIFSEPMLSDYRYNPRLHINHSIPKKQRGSIPSPITSYHSASHPRSSITSSSPHPRSSIPTPSIIDIPQDTPTRRIQSLELELSQALENLEEVE